MQHQQGVKHRVSAFTPARRAVDAWVAGAAQARPVRVIFGNADHHALERRVAKKTVEAVLEKGLPSQLQVLLGAVGSHAGTYTRRRDHGPEGRQDIDHFCGNWKRVSPSLTIPNSWRARSSTVSMPFSALALQHRAHDYARASARFRHADRQSAASVRSLAPGCRYPPTGGTAGHPTARAERGTTNRDCASRYPG